MTFEEIDRALSGWNQRLAAIADNLLELQNDPTYQVLTGAGGITQVQLAGETARRVLPALKPIATIFREFSLLQSVIDRAVALRKDLPVFGREQTLREIEALLLGPSIQLPADAVLLKDRTLLSGSAGTLMIRPEELLAGMAKAFGEARDAVLLVSGAWDDLAREVDAAEGEMRRLEGMAASAKCEVPPSVRAAETALGRLKQEIQDDPVAVREALRGQLMLQLARAAGELKIRLGLRQQMVAAAELLERLRAVEREAEVAAAMGREKIARAAGADVVRQSESMAAWLGRLEARCEVERAETMARGLENWMKAANKSVEACVQALEHERAPLEMRSELRGRLDALKAKARVYGVAEDAVLAGLAGQAEALLYAHPTDLVKSLAAVEAYERGLMEPGAAGPAPSRSGETGSTGERR